MRDRVRGVAAGRHTGFFLSGRGGIGKSHTVTDELERCGVAYRLWNSVMTARCLFDRLATNPEAVHCIEDIEGLTKDRRAVGVLRSALWGSRRGRDGQMERLMTWNARGASDQCIFTGGLILQANRRLRDLPELDALKSRISSTDLDISDREIAALMRRVSLEGYPKDANLLEPEQCLEVASFIIEESARINCRRDVRMLINGFEDRLQAEDLDSGCGWEDLVAARIRERPAIVGDVEPAGVRAQKKAKQLEVARSVAALAPEERLQAWEKRTGGASRATLYRRLNELAKLDAVDFES